MAAAWLWFIHVPGESAKKVRQSSKRASRVQTHQRLTHLPAQSGAELQRYPSRNNSLTKTVTFPACECLLRPPWFDPAGLLLDVLAPSLRWKRSRKNTRACVTRSEAPVIKTTCLRLPHFGDGFLLSIRPVSPPAPLYPASLSPSYTTDALSSLLKGNCYAAFRTPLK